MNVGWLLWAARLLCTVCYFLISHCLNLMTLKLAFESACMMVMFCGCDLAALAGMSIYSYVFIYSLGFIAAFHRPFWWEGCLQSGRRAETQFIQVAYLQVAIELIACAWSGLPLRLSPFDSHDVNYCTAGRNFCFGKVESSWKCWPRADKLKGPVHTRKVSIPNPKEGIQKVHGNSQLWVDRLLDSTAFSSVPFKGVTRKRSSLKASVKKYDC